MADKSLPKSVSASVSKLSREATFVFSGRVEREASSSLSLIPSSPATAVVRVDRIYHAPPDLDDQRGQDVTVVFAEGFSPEQGNGRRVFFTDPVAYGETMGVRELGSIEEPDEPEVVQGLVARVTAEMDEERIQEHLESADAVIHGRVTEMHRAHDAHRRFSEHDPDWWIARIEVIRSIKGDLGGSVEVRYPNSRDVRWYLVPKPKEGQEAIFVLHHDGERGVDAALAILHPNDLVRAESDELDRHARLV